VVRDPGRYPWHDAGFRPPPFNDLVIYQLHIGTFNGPDLENRPAKFLDVLGRLDHLLALGVNAVEPLPVTEFMAPRSFGYDGSDLYSPEMAYSVAADDPHFDDYLALVNRLLGRRGAAPLRRDQLAVQTHQLKALIDILHLHGVAVLFDVVYNHAGGDITNQDESLWFFDRYKDTDNRNNSLYFTDQNETGPVFATWNSGVRQFLIDNATFLIREYHIDGFRYDHAKVLVDKGGDGWSFWQALTGTERFNNPKAVQVAEYWPVDPFAVKAVAEGGAGFDASWHDGLRERLRNAIGQAANGGPGASLDLGRVAGALRAPGFPAAWKAVQYLESHDEVHYGRSPRVARLADGSNARSWYARSRARVATGLLLTAPGIPLLFMGEEFLEDKPWSDNPQYERGTLLYWAGLDGGDKVMGDFFRFARDLFALRRHHPALRGEFVNAYHVWEPSRVLAFHRWLGDAGRDVVVVASLNEATYYDYQLGFPGPGWWYEVFNSDVYDNWVNPIVAGNGSGVRADGPPLHGLPASARVVIPANGLVVFARDKGD
jgi:1,4-alpha-glucan branching enzyme